MFDSGIFVCIGFTRKSDVLTNSMIIVLSIESQVLNIERFLLKTWLVQVNFISLITSVIRLATTTKRELDRRLCQELAYCRV